jgi:L-threonylcarbamoyladenylate synthase
MKPTDYNSLTQDGLTAQIAGGAIGVLPTDTQYGLVCAYDNITGFERLYTVKERPADKPVILLAASIDQLLEIEGLDRNSLLMAERFWPGPVSVVVACKAHVLTHIHRGMKSVACRVPDEPALQSLLEMTGPLVAPSANPHGREPAGTVAMAEEYFGNEVDFYVDGGDLTGRPPSTIISFDEDGLVDIIRQGAAVIS